MRTRTVGIVLGFLGAWTSAARTQEAKPETRVTPPQPFFAWTRLDFDAGEHERRRAAVRARLAASGGGILLVPSADGRSGGETFRQLDDFVYLTGLELPQSLLALDSDSGTAMLFVPGTDRRFTDPARRNDFPGRRLARDPELARQSGIETVRTASELDPQLAAWATAGRSVRVNAGRGDIEAPATAAVRTWTPAQSLLLHLQSSHPDLAVVNAFVEVAAVRAVKSPAEIVVLRRACDATMRGMRAAASAIRDGVTERELEGVLEAGFKRHGAQRPAFASIIKSGPNSLWPWRILAAHYDRRNRAMAAGELVIFDVGCELDHYASDVGRTFPVSGSFTPRQRELVAMVTAVSDAVIAAVHPGITLAELQRVARSNIPPEAQRFMQAGHFFGHHIGLEVGDPALPNAPLEPGMVFTVEPWYYNHDEEVAVFVEDVVLVTETGAENLTASLPRAPDELERMVGPAPSPALRILSYNIRHGAGMDGEVDLRRAAALINRLRPDVVALQEIDNGTTRTDGVDQARRLGALCGMHAMFGAFMEFQGGGYGMALLSRHPVEAVTNHRLPDGREPRTALTARIRLTGTDRRVVVAGIHLYATEAERMAQARTLLALFEDEPLPVLLVGDFNSRPDSPVMALLDGHWQAIEKRGWRHTFRADQPDHEIDFVLIPDGGPLEAVDCRVIDEPLVSDHRPVLADLRWLR